MNLNSAYASSYSSSLFQGDITYAELRAALMNFTQLMSNQAQVITNNLISQRNHGDRPYPNVITPSSRIRDLMKMNPPNSFALRWMNIPKVS